MKNSVTQMAAAMKKAKATFAALVETKRQLLVAEQAKAKAAAKPVRESIHYTIL